MLRHRVMRMATPALVLVIFLGMADTAAAQQIGRRGGPPYGFSPWFVGGSSFYSPYYGNPYGGWNPQAFEHYAPITQTYGYGYDSPKYSNQGYVDDRVFLPGTIRNRFEYYPREMRSARGQIRHMSAYAPENPSAVRLDVWAPASAEIWVDGVKTTQLGEHRVFVSPPLIAAQEYSYLIRAAWTDLGQPVEQTRTVRFRAGDSVTVDFTTAAPQSTNEPSITHELRPRKTLTTPMGGDETPPLNPE